MLKYYIKTALRNFQTNKVIFAGSLATLSLGALCISLLFSYVHNELTMDDFHKRKRDIYIMVRQNSPNEPLSIMHLHSRLNFDYKKFPEIESLVRVQKYPEGRMKLESNKSVYSPEGIVVDSTFFQVFDFRLKIGDEKKILSNPDGILLSDNYAKKMFGDQNPIGKNIKVLAGNEVFCTVVGIFESPPSNSSITFDFILPYSDEPNQYSTMGIAFLLVNKSFNKELFEEKIKDINNNLEKVSPKLTESITSVIPFNSLYFNAKHIERTAYFFKSGDVKNIRILMVVILVILIITVLNFSNLQIINTRNSIKASALMMVNGAQKRNLFFQKIFEIGLIIIITASIITILYHIALPYFNNFVNIELAPPNLEVIIINVGILTLVTFLALLYPFIVTLKLSLVKSLKNNPFLGNNFLGKKSIVISQYTLTFILLISAIIVFKQLDKMLEKDLGFNHKNIISIKFFSGISNTLKHSDFNNYKQKQKFLKAKIKEYADNVKVQKETYQFVKNELSNYSAIKNFSQGTSPLKSSRMNWKIYDKENDYTAHNGISVTPNSKELFGFKLVEGRFFEHSRDKSRGNGIIINETAKQYWGFKDLSDSRLDHENWSHGPSNNSKPYFNVLGVVKDFNYEHLSVKPQPLIMFYMQDIYSEFYIEFREGSVQEGLKYVEELFNKVNPGETFTYSFLSDEIAELYKKEKRLSIIYILFTIIALIISAIGLFTIALYDTQSRTKEIGIRKVNGATINQIMLMLNKDFVKWVGIAFIIACPIAYYAMSKWLENFAYKTSLSWWVFALAGVFTLVIALLTVSWQSYRAATRNPIEALRDE